ncbi:unnamed protein product [Danaus chrysippus]|uniref:(African queen) hypothetical protein n=1 Tax=Danaus chrysippus TaxID=151541 RepID=A0A8J2R572_9NEOP|nr:unnamed protein product [Danaus chrysippus]
MQRQYYIFVCPPATCLALLALARRSRSFSIPSTEFSSCGLDLPNIGRIYVFFNFSPGCLCDVSITCVIGKCLQRDVVMGGFRLVPAHNATGDAHSRVQIASITFG